MECLVCGRTTDQSTYLGQSRLGISALASTATITSRFRVRTNRLPSGMPSKLDEPSISSSHDEFESSKVSGLID